MDADAVRRYFEALVSGAGPARGPGFSCAVFRHGEAIYTASHGLASLEHNAPITTDSLFYLASVSKQFTAACVLRMAKDGRLGLRQDVRELIPQTRHFKHKIAVQHLLNHTSGLPDYFAYLDTQPSRRESDYFDNADTLAIVRRLRGLLFPPGDRFDYSNTNYVLLAEAARVSTGQTLARYAKKHVFGPLGMRATLYDDDRGRVVPSRVTGYLCAPGKTRAYRVHLKNSCTVGDGGVLSSISDLIKWERYLHAGDDSLGFSLRALTARGRLRDGRLIDYGNGLELVRRGGVLCNFHSGGFDGFSADVFRLPPKKLSAIYLSNRPRDPFDFSHRYGVNAPPSRRGT